VRLKHLLLDLKNATKIHLQRVREAWDANRP
jgi:hypothetical protein